MAQASNRTPEDTTRTTITLSRDLLRRLKIEAAERGTSMNEVVCRALEAHVQHAEPGEDRSKPRSLASFDSGHVDTARRAGDLRQEFEPRSWR